MATKKSNKQLWIMLALIAVIVAAILLLPSCVSEGGNDAERATLVKAGEIAPDFTVEMFEGDPITLSKLQKDGKVVLVTFWASWCPSCQAEMKRVQSDIVERFSGKDFVYLPISREETRDAVAEFREKNGYTFPMGLDPIRAIYKLYATDFVPRDFLIDRKGKVVVTKVGYDAKDFDKLIATIEQTLE